MHFRRLIPSALILGVLAACGPRLAAAEPEKFPDPRFSYHPAVLTGTSNGDAVPCVSPTNGMKENEFTVVCVTSDLAPSMYRIVTIHFAGTGVKLYMDQGPDCTLDLSNQTLATSSGPTGRAVFHPRFGGSCPAGVAWIDGEGIDLGTVALRSTDMDAQGGSTGLGDFTMFAPLFVAGATNHPEADFDGSGGPVGLGDFTIFAREYMSGAAGTYCP